MPSPTFLRVLRIWFGIGLQSFGGGSATMNLIHREAVVRERWITDLEFTQLWAICQVAPGINLLAFTILIGRRAAGAAGIVAALLGLLIPSVTITIAMTAIYSRIRTAPAMRAALNGILPATIGLGVLASYQIVRPLVVAAPKEGWDTVAVYALILVGSGLIVQLCHVPVVFAPIGCSVLAGVHAWLRSRFVGRSEQQ